MSRHITHLQVASRTHYVHIHICIRFFNKLASTMSPNYRFIFLFRVFVPKWRMCQNRIELSSECHFSCRIYCFLQMRMSVGAVPHFCLPIAHTPKTKEQRNRWIIPAIGISEYRKYPFEIEMELLPNRCISRNLKMNCVKLRTNRELH